MSALPGPDRVRGAGTVADVAIIEGRGAALLAHVLLSRLADGKTLRRILGERGFSPVDQNVAERALRALEQAGAEWRERTRFPADGNAATDGNDEAALSEAMIDSATAAVLLGVGARRVRQLAQVGDLQGIETPLGRRFDRSEVVALRERRMAER